jgi:D-tyrosyl-tRNA(Tyr) deacylase
VVDGSVVGEIAGGALVLLGIERGDTEELAGRMAERLARFRMFGDSEGRMNRDVSEVGGSFLVVSQFTLCADLQRGRRPSFDAAEAPERAEALVECFVAELGRLGVPTATGSFGARMLVELSNDGPVTFVFALAPGTKTGA